MATHNATLLPDEAVPFYKQLLRSSSLTPPQRISCISGGRYWTSGQLSPHWDPNRKSLQSTGGQPCHFDLPHHFKLRAVGQQGEQIKQGTNNSRNTVGACTSASICNTWLCPEPSCYQLAFPFSTSKASVTPPFLFSALFYHQLFKPVRFFSPWNDPCRGKDYTRLKLHVLPINWGQITAAQDGMKMFCTPAKLSRHALTSAPMR